MRPGELILLVIAFAMGIMLLVIPAQSRKRGYEQGLQDGREIARHKLDSIQRVIDNYSAEMLKAHEMAVHWRTIADSLTNVKTHYPPVPRGIPADARRERILSGTADPL